MVGVNSKKYILSSLLVASIIVIIILKSSYVEGRQIIDGEPTCPPSTCSTEGSMCTGANAGKTCTFIDNGICSRLYCACTPSCTGKTCGSNGCGGTCGSCDDTYQTCSAGNCIIAPDYCPRTKSPVSTVPQLYMSFVASSDISATRTVNLTTSSTLCPIGTGSLQQCSTWDSNNVTCLANGCSYSYAYNFCAPKTTYDATCAGILDPTTCNSASSPSSGHCQWFDGGVDPSYCEVKQPDCYSPVDAGTCDAIAGCKWNLGECSEYAPYPNEGMCIRYDNSFCDVNYCDYTSPVQCNAAYNHGACEMKTSPASCFGTPTFQVATGSVTIGSSSLKVYERTDWVVPWWSYESCSFWRCTTKESNTPHYFIGTCTVGNACNWADGCRIKQCDVYSKDEVRVTPSLSGPWSNPGGWTATKVHISGPDESLADMCWGAGFTSLYIPAAPCCAASTFGCNVCGGCGANVCSDTSANCNVGAVSGGVNNCPVAAVCQGACTPESDPGLCSRLGKNCGSLTAPDNCNNSRTVNCGPTTDNNACTQTDTCTNNVVVGSNPVICTASDQCHSIGVCDTSSGVCSNPTKANGAVCNDANACTSGDSCQTGVCVGTPLSVIGAACNDGNACTTNDVYTNACGACAGNAITCTALDQCHVAGVCNSGTGICTNLNKANGASCSDSNACTTGDVCFSGSCNPGSPLNCNDANSCTTDSCNAMIGCVNANNPVNGAWGAPVTWNPWVDVGSCGTYQPSLQRQDRSGLLTCNGASCGGICPGSSATSDIQYIACCVPVNGTYDNPITWGPWVNTGVCGAYVSGKQNQTRTGTKTCSGTCGGTCPGSPTVTEVQSIYPYSGSCSACVCSGVAGTFNTCTNVCDGRTCSAPPNYGTACNSAPNNCGTKNAGSYLCDGVSCSAAAPADVPLVCAAAVDVACNAPITKVSGCASATCSGKGTKCAVGLVCDSTLGCIAACGDGACSAGENSGSCPTDCPISCGDGLCNGVENCLNCASDCGTCSFGWTGRLLNGSNPTQKVTTEGYVYINGKSYVVSNGDIAVAGVPGGTWSVSAGATGFGMNTTSIVFSGSSNTVADIVLPVESCSSLCVLGNRCDYSCPGCGSVDADVQVACRDKEAGIIRSVDNTRDILCCVGNAVSKSTYRTEFELYSTYGRIAKTERTVSYGGVDYRAEIFTWDKK